MASSLALLDSVNFNLEYNDPMQDMSEALAACASALDDWAQASAGPQQMSVYPKPVAYDSTNQRDGAFNLYLERNPDQADTYTAEEWAEEKAAYGILGDAVATATQRNSIFYMVSKQNMVFSHSWHLRHWGNDNAAIRQQHQLLDRECYEFVIVLNRRKAYIYDPSYNPDDAPAVGRRALRLIPFVGSRALKMLREIRTRRQLAIDAVYIGGGGNVGGDYRKMNLQWIRGLVVEMVTTQQWDTRQVEWERVNNS